MTKKEVKKLLLINIPGITNEEDIISYHRGFVYYMYKDFITGEEFIHSEIPMDVMYLFSTQIPMDVIINNGLYVKSVTIFHKILESDGTVGILIISDDEIIYDEMDIQSYYAHVSKDYTKQNLNIIDEI